VRIVILVEGATEKALFPALRRFLEPRLEGRMPRLTPDVYDRRLPKEDALRRAVTSLLGSRADHVIALTDVYTGSGDFLDAADAKKKMERWVGPEPRFHPHAAQHDFEAWLLPYWDEILRRAGSNRRPFGPHPEKINHGKPPADRLQEVYRTGSHGRSYKKTIDALAILKDADLTIAIDACPELKALVDTIIKLAGGAPLTPSSATSPPPGRSRSGRRTPRPA
jgi:hypothetical protein